MLLSKIRALNRGQFLVLAVLATIVLAKVFLGSVLTASSSRSTAPPLTIQATPNAAAAGMIPVRMAGVPKRDRTGSAAVSRLDINASALDA